MFLGNDRKVLTVKELSKKVKEVTGVPKYVNEDVIRTLFDVITQELSYGHDICISNFGTFYLMDVQEREYKIPNHDEVFVKPAHKDISFRYSRNMKNKFNMLYGCKNEDEIAEDLVTVRKKHKKTSRESDY